MKYAITLTLLASSLYICVSGYQAAKILQQGTLKTNNSEKSKTYEYHGIVFADEQSLMDFVGEQQASRWFGWIFNLPGNLVLLVGCMAAGLFGGGVRIMMRLATKPKTVTYNKVLVDPIVGASIGVLLFFFSMAVPAMFSSGSGPVRPETALVFSMCGGLFSEQAYKWLEAQVSRLIFHTKPKES